ncbi:hypothetical protein [Pelagerythrobacter aerophilus]|uniref:Uncharacterized protein n=1 Tax=Pelagerythrobacter aerophilus TaxID=2306995 RepID=A0A418NEH1_9SPHN|nr:hypothetical protein [Pelagerythrobacter aerophilus]RIV75807.1 hypothetical protein D2V04_16190 [Pelagerythrobacter aerophilus]
MTRFAFLAFPLPLLLAACEPADNEPGPGGVTVGEAKALDEAAEMLDQQRLPPAVFDEPAPDEGAETPSSPAATPTAEPAPAG